MMKMKIMYFKCDRITLSMLQINCYFRAVVSRTFAVEVADVVD